MEATSTSETSVNFYMAATAQETVIIFATAAART
jgi:hypothetical protein